MYSQYKAHVLQPGTLRGVVGRHNSGGKEAFRSCSGMAERSLLRSVGPGIYAWFLMPKIIKKV